MPNFSELNELCRVIPDDSRHFPNDVFRAMKKLGLLKISVPNKNSNQKSQLFQTLFEIGKASLSVGRIYEGHINALKLIEDFGTRDQQEFYFNEAENGKLFSVWNTEMPSEAVTGEIKDEAVHITGAKTFCSGGLQIDYGLITAEVDKQKQLIIIPLKQFERLEEDWSLWNPMGMKNSGSCRIDFSELKLPLQNLLGGGDEYEKEPWFSGGAMRFAAVQLGGAMAIMQATRDHLVEQTRTSDPYQQQRLGNMAVQMQTGKLWLDKAQHIYDNPEQYTSSEIVNFANMMRTVILDICEKILHLAERSVGVQGFMESHPLEQLYRDLKVYLKQPAPDLALQSVGKYTFENKN